MFSRREFLVSVSGSLATGALNAAQKTRPNVLFIAVDDMRPDVGCYGNSYVKTPNLDKLASRGTVFTRAYCQQAVCSPSRTSLLTGRRPDTTRVYELQTHFRKNLPDVITLPEHFKNNGYVTTGLSKIYHGGLDDPNSWSIPSWTPGSAAAWNTAANAERNQNHWNRLKEAGLSAPPTAPARVNRQQRGPSWDDPDVKDNELPDGKTADAACKALGELKDKPFFLAVGFLKPHLPFVAPRKYFDLYPERTVKMPDYPEPPRNVPQIAMHSSGELRNYADIPEKGPVSEQKARELVRSYYASISYTDAQIGRVLDELDRQGLRDKTVVIVWGDHGYHLGDHGLWNKHTNFERAVRVPMIISVPGQKSAGRKSQGLTEFVDIYPTLVELCGLPVPEGLEGTSFAPLLDRPNRQWKTAAFSQYPRGKGAMGYSMRTDRYRYTEWRIPGSDERPAELYDYQADPDEKVNLAALPEHAGMVKHLSERLNAGWRAAIPAS